MWPYRMFLWLFSTARKAKEDKRLCISGSRPYIKRVPQISLENYSTILPRLSLSFPVGVDGHFRFMTEFRLAL